MTILQELWRTAPRNDVPLDATWMWGRGTGGLGCVGPGETDSVRDSGTGWLR